MMRLCGCSRSRLKALAVFLPSVSMLCFGAASRGASTLDVDAYWSWATNRNTAQAYRCFAFHYSTDARAAEASNRWEELDFEAAWRRNNTYASKRFLACHPGSRFAEQLLMNQMDTTASPETPRFGNVPDNEMADRAVEVLLAALKDDSVFVRERSAVTLGELRDARAVDPLICALKLSGGTGRDEVSRALGAIGDPRALEALLQRKNSYQALEAIYKIDPEYAVKNFVKMLRDTNTLTRIIATRELGDMGDPRAVKPLVAALKDEDQFMRCAAAESLGKIGDKRAIDALVGMLKIPNEYGRGDVARALGKLGDPRAVEPLMALFKKEDTDIFLRLAIAKSLIDIGTPDAFDFVLSAVKDGRLSDDQDVVVDQLCAIDKQRTCEALVTACRDLKQFWTVRNKAVEMLAYRVDSGTAVALLIDNLQDSNEFVRQHAARLLGGIGDPRAVEALTAVAMGNADTYLRSKSIEALGEIGDPFVVDTLVSTLNDSNEYVRSSSCKALGALGDSRAMGPLVSVVKDATNAPWLRLVATRALEKIDKPRARQCLLGLLQDPNNKVRQEAAQAMGDLPDPDTVDALISALKDTDNYVRANAVGALGKIGDVRALEALIAALDDENAWVYNAAIVAAGKMKVRDPRVVENLYGRLADKSDETVLASAVALASIGDPRAIDTLARMSSKKKNYEDTAKDAIASIRNPACVDELLAIAASPRFGAHRLKSSAAEALVAISLSGSSRPLLSALSHTNQKIRVFAAEVNSEVAKKKQSLLSELDEHVETKESSKDSGSNFTGPLGILAQMKAAGSRAGTGDVEALATVQEGLRNTQIEIQFAAIEGLTQAGEKKPVVIENLKAALAETKSDTVKLKLVGELAKMQDPAALVEIKKYVKSEDASERIYAATVLGSGAQNVPEELVVALDDADGGVRVHAATAILRLLSAQSTHGEAAVDKRTQPGGMIVPSSVTTGEE